MNKWIIARHDSREENISVEVFSGNKTEMLSHLKESSESDINTDSNGLQRANIYEDTETSLRVVVDFDGYNIMYQAIDASVL